MMILRLLALMFSLAFFLIASPVLAQSTQYLSALPDIPLMQGLEEGAGSTLSFDKPEGRILSVHAIAHGVLDEIKLFKFYDETLPQLGWKKQEKGTYLREKEQLTLSVYRETDGSVVQFLITPRDLK